LPDNPKEDGMTQKENKTWFLIRMIEEGSIQVSEILAAAVLLYVLQKLAAIKESS
jgi:hypothetical protein